MANTPKYTFTTPSPYNAAISGGMTALGGIMAEKASSQKSADQLNSFAGVLRQQGLMGDAMIYEQMALAQEPDFVSAALTGKPTTRSLTEPFDHALKILDSEATRKARIAEANARSGGDSDYRRIMAARDDDSDERNTYKDKILKLRTLSAQYDDKIQKARDNEGDESKVALLKADKKEIDDKIAELEGSVDTTLQNQRTKTGAIGGGSTGTNVGTDGAVTLPNGGEAPLPVADPPGSYQGSPLLNFGPTELTPEQKKTTIGEAPAGAVASPSTLAPFDWRNQVADAEKMAIPNPPASVAPLPSPSIAALTPALNMADLDARPVGRSTGLPGAPQRQRYDATEQLAQADEAFRAASAPAIDFDTEFAGPPIPEIRDPRFVGPIEVRKALLVEEEGGMLSDLGAVPSEEGTGVLRTPDSEVYKALAPEAEVQKQTTEGAPPVEEVDPDIAGARERLQDAKNAVIAAFDDVGVDNEGVSAAVKMVKDVKRIKDLTVIERRLSKFRDTKGQWPYPKAAIDAGERARKDMPDGNQFYTSVKVNPQNGLHTWYLVKKGAISLGGDGKWHGEDGTVWYPDPKTKFMVKVPPDGQPVYETKAGTDDGVSQSEWESDMAKLKKSEIFNSPDLENASPKQELRNLVPGGATNATPSTTPNTPAASKPVEKVGTKYGDLLNPK